MRGTSDPSGIAWGFLTHEPNLPKHLRGENLRKHQRWWALEVPAETANNRLTLMTFTFCSLTGASRHCRCNCSKAMKVRWLTSWPYTRKVILDGPNGSSGMTSALTAKGEGGRGSPSPEAWRRFSVPLLAWRRRKYKLETWIPLSYRCEGWTSAHRQGAWSSPQALQAVGHSSGGYLKFNHVRPSAENRAIPRGTSDPKESWANTWVLMTSLS